MTKDDSMQDINSYIESLEIENKYLKALLDKAGITYDVSQAAMDSGAMGYAPDQGVRIKLRNIIEYDANRFFDMFWGRMDVYSERRVSKTTGKASYYPQCSNFWKYGCHRHKRDKIKCQDCEMQAYKSLELKDIMAHLRGASPDATDVIGIYPLYPDDTCRFLVFDFDNHE